MELPALLQDADLDRPLFRVMRYEHVLSWFKTGRLVLRNPGIWDDPFENMMLRVQATLTSNKKRISLAGIFAKFFGDCWTFDDRDRDEFWRIYAPGKDGVRVETTVRAIVNAFVDRKEKDWKLRYFCGRVEYLNQDAIAKLLSSGRAATAIALDPTNRSQAETLFIKRETFSHEQEFRLVYCDHDHQSKDGRLLELDVPPAPLITRVLADGRMALDKFNLLGQTLLGDGFKGPVQRSGIYDPPQLKLVIDDTNPW